MNEPKLTIGILFEPKIEFELHHPFLLQTDIVSGLQTVEYKDNKIVWNGRLYDQLHFIPKDESNGFFELKDVTIGINFHWERKENQRFRGELKIIVEDGKLTAINVISTEDYLLSVISSEMSATASLEFLKAHAVISRSWVLKPILHPQTEDISPENMHNDVIWYERDAHTNFDICADDHCQRYQGITRASTEIVKQAIEDTHGMVLTYNGTICDARFSKCCGGVFEEFQHVWANTIHPYLLKKRDCDEGMDTPDLRNETVAHEWIKTSPEAFCNTTDKKVLAQVLNNYDQETTGFYRWKVTYTQEELSKLIMKRSGVDYGEILDMIPVERGTSGRLVRLKIVGSKQTRIIGKELEIRRTLSESHLYSSAFTVDKVMGNNTAPEEFILTGAGWGHGVGLCQIGAAVMGEKKCRYDEILLHYYTGAQIDKLY